MTGRWTGYYVQRDEQHPLTAELLQAGGQLTGTMRDRDTGREESVFEMRSEGDFLLRCVG